VSDETDLESSQGEPARVPGSWEAHAEDEPRPWWLAPAGGVDSAGDTTLHDDAPTADRIPIREEPASRSRPRSMQLVALFLAALLGAGVGTGVTLAVRDEGSPASGSPVQVAKAPAGGALPGGVASVAAAVLPSIVRINVEARGPFGQTASGTGSGVIYRADGYIITNAHVVQDADSVEVRLSNGERLDGSVVGTGDATGSGAGDIAVIKVARTGLPAATFGSTKSLRPGDLAVAIGSPFGLQGTVTAGVISALHRNVAEIGTTDAIQTDAPINPGNSGGALADARGAVVGINQAIVNPNGGGNVGVGFAIPVEIARRLADEIIRTGHGRLPYLGISGENLPNGGGALVVEVAASGPAARAGLRPDDVIVSLAGHRITSMDELIEILIQRRVGERVAIAYLRNGARRTTTTTLVERP
jgi:S1-C subfamily serine protease